MDEAAVETAGADTLKPGLAAIAGLKSRTELAALLAKLHLEGGSGPALFGFGSGQAPRNASQVIGFATRDLAKIGRPVDREEWGMTPPTVNAYYNPYMNDINFPAAVLLPPLYNPNLGGTLLAYLAWKEDAKGQKLEPRDGLTPDQRFFVGFSQWVCGGERPESLRLSARVNPHSPYSYRINGVVVNMPEFAQAFSCKPGQPTFKEPEKVCRIW